ncbi:27843_t:CDS:1, partial [Dentiscutata erythropus]
ELKKFNISQWFSKEFIFTVKMAEFTEVGGVMQKLEHVFLNTDRLLLSVSPLLFQSYSPNCVLDSKTSNTINYIHLN